jgi:hypothetical protein
MRYMLRSRLADDQPWSDWEEFKTPRARDRAASQARAFAGIRTHSANFTKAEYTAWKARQEED